MIHVEHPDTRREKYPVSRHNTFTVPPAGRLPSRIRLCADRQRCVCSSACQISAHFIITVTSFHCTAHTHALSPGENKEGRIDANKQIKLIN